MKRVIEIIAFSTLIVLPFAACSNDNNSTANNVDTAKTTAELPKTSVETATVSIGEIVKGYLSLKNALTVDKTKEAATAGAALEATFKSFNKAALTAEQKKVFEDVEDDAKEHAEHIGSNGGNIEHQREHFETLSKDIYALVKAFGAGQTLYQDFCPMYNDKKGAIWLSETKGIQNPYYGKKMLSCGSMKEELK
ncbi:MAG: DUF3347 domain-containing protein [Saprospiraceae bacterium]|nr:DUF3347 domain-containing protein [Saprospiraceae bacterium]